MRLTWKKYHGGWKYKEHECNEEVLFSVVSLHGNVFLLLQSNVLNIYPWRQTIFKNQIM